MLRNLAGPRLAHAQAFGHFVGRATIPLRPKGAGASLWVSRERARTPAESRPVVLVGGSLAVGFVRRNYKSGSWLIIRCVAIPANHRQ